jgi:hypothetical protein
VEKRFSDSLRFFVTLGGGTLAGSFHERQVASTTHPRSPLTNHPLYSASVRQKQDQDSCRDHTEVPTGAMGKAKKTRKFAQVKRMISSRDGRLKKNAEKEAAATAKTDKDEIVREMFVPLSFFPACIEKSSTDLRFVTQSSSGVLALLPIQRSAPTTVLGAG